MGDFNIHTERSDNVHAIERFDLLTSFDRCQHIKEATQNAGGCIDLIITSSDCCVEWLKVSEVGLSDALSPVVCQSNYQRSRRPLSKVTKGSVLMLTHSKLTWQTLVCAKT